MGELARGDVDGHHEAAVARLVPLPSLRAGGPQGPLPERHREPAHVGEGDEVGRALQPLVAAPPQERLDAHDGAGLALDDGLPVELQLPLHEGPPQRGLLRLPLGGEGARARGVHVPGVAALLLGPLQRHRRALEERLGVRPVVGEERDPQARGDEEVVAADAEGAPEGEAQLVRDDRHVLVPLDAGEEEGEHVPGDAGDRVALAQRALEGEGDAAQEVVAVAAAEPLVHLGEAVEAELDDGELLAVALRVDDRDRQAVAEPAGAREPGERVLVGEGPDLLLRAGAGRALAPELLLEAGDLGAQGADLLLELDLAGGLGRRRRRSFRLGRRARRLGGRSARRGRRAERAPRRRGARARRGTASGSSSRSWAASETLPDPGARGQGGGRRAADEAVHGLGEPGPLGVEPGGVPGQGRSRGRVAERGARAGQQEPRLRLRGAPLEQRARAPPRPVRASAGGRRARRRTAAWTTSCRAASHGRSGRDAAASEQHQRAGGQAQRAGPGQRPRPHAGGAGGGGGGERGERGVRRDAEVEVHRRVDGERGESGQRAGADPAHRAVGPLGDPLARGGEDEREAQRARGRGRARPSRRGSRGSRSRRARRGRCRGRA